MKENTTIKKKLLPYVLVVCIALLIEIFVFNFRSYGSLFYEEKLLGEFESHVENDKEAGVSSLFINTAGEMIHNIYLDLGFLDRQSGRLEGGGVEVAIQDETVYEGNRSFRQVTERAIIPDKGETKYVFFVSYEGIQQIRINFPLRDDKSLRIYEIKLNAHRPIFFSFGRFVIMVVVGVLILVLYKKFAVRKLKPVEPGKTDHTC